MENIEQTFCYLSHYCSCPDHELMILDPRKMKRYEREGYPKFIRGHEHKGKSPWNKGKSWDKETLDKITRINRERTKRPDYVHGMKGKHHTPEANEANRIAHLGNKNAEGHIVSEEARNKISEKNKGHVSPMKGVKRKLESNLKQSISMTGKNPWNKGLVGVQESPMKGKNHTPETIKKIKENTPIRSGEDHWNWQGGISPLNEQIRHSTKYDEWRTSIFERDSYICQECHKSGCFVEAHHLKEFSEILKENNITSLEEALSCQELWDISNGVTLCQDCHNKTKNK